MGGYYRRLFAASVRQAFKAVFSYRLRSLFVVVAVSLGIASLSVIVATLEGANRSIDEMVKAFGSDAAFVHGGNVFSRATGQRTRTISWNDVNTMRRSLPGVYIVAPMSFRMGNPTAIYGNRNYQISQLQGSTENYSRIWDWEIAQGRDISAADMERAGSVALIGSTIARELFGDEPALGKSIQIEKIPFTVIGVLRERGGSMDRMDEAVAIPLSTMIKRFNQDRQYFQTVRLKFEDPENLETHAANLTGLLRHLHGLAPDQPDDFRVFTSLDIQRFIGMIKNGLGVFLGITALAAMCVSGFVLANLFYISVSERSTEVGLRKALGAPGSAITLQFLCESVLLTIGGAALGVIWGMLLGLTLHSGLFAIEFSPLVFLSSLAAAVLVGVVFGLKPAHRAAALDPISALKGQG